jgi:uncharacterized protein (TIGR02246 family)
MATDPDKNLIDLETAFFQTMKDKDVTRALSLTDDPVIVTGGQGLSRISREKFAKLMTGATWELLDFEITAIETRQLTDDVAIIGYKVWEKLVVDGEEIELDAADTSVWVRKDGRWVCAMHTEAVRGDPYGRDRVGADAVAGDEMIQRVSRH